jgi:hypothetical protein
MHGSGRRGRREGAIRSLTRPVSHAQMGHLFEELIRKFAELSNETAGEHFTPREVIRLMARTDTIYRISIRESRQVRSHACAGTHRAFSGSLPTMASRTGPRKAISRSPIAVKSSGGTSCTALPFT